MKRALALAIALTACAAGSPGPAVLDTKNEACGFCRMAVSDQRFAGQLVAPHEEPKFFDDIGCLGRYVAGTKTLPAGSVAYVADHRTKAWVMAAGAVYTRVAKLETPMGSHVIAHADAASRDADPEAGAGTPVPLTELFGAGGAPGGSR